MGLEVYFARSSYAWPATVESVIQELDGHEEATITMTNSQENRELVSTDKIVEVKQEGTVFWTGLATNVKYQSKELKVTAYHEAFVYLSKVLFTQDYSGTPTPASDILTAIVAKVVAAGYSLVKGDCPSTSVQVRFEKAKCWDAVVFLSDVLNLNVIMDYSGTTPRIGIALKGTVKGPIRYQDISDNTIDRSKKRTHVWVKGKDSTGTVIWGEAGSGNDEVVFYEKKASSVAALTGIANKKLAEINTNASGSTITSNILDSFLLTTGDFVYIDNAELNIATTYTVKESYTNTPNTAHSLYSYSWKAIIFTASASYFIRKVRLRLYRVGSPGTVVVSIRATSGGLPTGSDLAVGAINGNTLTSNAADVIWYDIVLDTAYFLSSGTTYAIVIRAPDGGAGNYAYVKSVSPGTNACTSGTAGKTWLSYPYDYCFETYQGTGLRIWKLTKNNETSKIEVDKPEAVLQRYLNQQRNYEDLGIYYDPFPNAQAVNLIRNGSFELGTWNSLGSPGYETQSTDYPKFGIYSARLEATGSEKASGKSNFVSVLNLDKVTISAYVKISEWTSGNFYGCVYYYDSAKAPLSPDHGDWLTLTSDPGSTYIRYTKTYTPSTDFPANTAYIRVMFLWYSGGAGPDGVAYIDGAMAQMSETATDFSDVYWNITGTGSSYPADPQVGDIWLLTIDHAFYRWTGTSWEFMGNQEVSLEALPQDNMIFNGMFETDYNNDGVPDGWTTEVPSGGITFSLDTSTSLEGKQSVKMVTNGTATYGFLKSKLYPIVPYKKYYVKMHVKATGTTEANQCKFAINFYNAAKTLLGTDYIWQGEPTTSWVEHGGLWVASSGAYYAQIVLRIDSSLDVRTLNFDCVWMYKQITWADLFDEETAVGTKCRRYEAEAMDVGTGASIVGDSTASKGYCVKLPSSATPALETIVNKTVTFGWAGDFYFVAQLMVASNSSTTKAYHMGIWDNTAGVWAGVMDFAPNYLRDSAKWEALAVKCTLRADHEYMLQVKRYNMSYSTDLYIDWTGIISSDVPLNVTDMDIPAAPSQTVGAQADETTVTTVTVSHNTYTDLCHVHVPDVDMDVLFVHFAVEVDTDMSAGNNSTETFRVRAYDGTSYYPGENYGLTFRVKKELTAGAVLSGTITLPYNAKTKTVTLSMFYYDIWVSSIDVRPTMLSWGHSPHYHVPSEGAGHQH